MRKKIETRGRKPAPEGAVRAERIACLLLPGEVPVVVAAARERGLSRSDLLRSGLVAIGVQLAEVAQRKPAD